MAAKQNTVVTAKARDLLGLDYIPESYLIETWSDETNPFVPPRHDDYVLRQDLVQKVLPFLSHPHGDALYLTGPTGCGKTSVILELCARLHWPVQSLTCNGRMEAGDLIGHYTMCAEKPGEPPQMRFQYGPLAKAMAWGHVLILNELDLVDPSEISKLNDVLEGRPLIIEENGGQIIRPHKMFRFVATGNTAGCGDLTGTYAGTVTQNGAAMDRYRMITVDYPDAAAEEGLLLKSCPGLPKERAAEMVKVAAETRRLYVGDDGAAGRVSVPMSTRTLIRWALLASDFRNTRTDTSPVAFALRMAYTNRLPPEEAKAVEVVCQSVYGERWNRAITAKKAA